MDSVKRTTAFFLALLLLATTALAAEEAFPYHTSDWARAEVSRAAELGLIYDPYNYLWDLEGSITREGFASNAAALVAKGFGIDLEGYVFVINYRGQAEGENFTYSAVDAAVELGILQGTGAGELDLNRAITRQEAAAMLARTYRAYQSAEPEVPEPVSFTDREDIADWALEDVALMSQLGIMKGVGDGRFDPLGAYTQEQCILSLLRLYETVPFDGAGRETPFSILEPQPGFRCTFPNSGYYVFALESEDYYVFSRIYPSQGWSNTTYDIYVIERDLSVRRYGTPILKFIGFRGAEHGKPENPVLSQDGTRLTYTVTLTEDAYRYDFYGETYADLLFEKGIYTVTMDLATGEQTWTRAELGTG